MELGIVLIGIATFINSVVLVRLIYSFKGRTGPEPTQNLPLPIIPGWQDAADGWLDEILEEPAPAAVKAVDDNSGYGWNNQSGIQQGVSVPAPPIVREQLPPLARPAGFV